MDAFIEGVGKRYLERKANNIPQQLGNLAKKHVSSATDTRKQAEQASTLPSEEKDQEIVKLMKQLAETKLDKAKASGEAKAVKSEKSKAISEAKRPKSEKSKAFQKKASETKHSGGSAKSVARLEKGLIPLSIDADTASKGAKDSKGSEAGRGRRSSASTATGAKDHKASSAKGGGHSSKLGNEKGELHGLEALGATEALPHKTKSHKAASGAQANEHKSTARSTISTLRASSDRRHSASQASEIGSEARSMSAVVAPRPPPPPPMHYPPPRKEPLYAEEIRHYEVEEPGMYVVDVEEEPRRRRKSMRERGGGGDPYVVEVLSSKGRTVYRVT